MVWSCSQEEGVCLFFFGQTQEEGENDAGLSF